MARIMAKDIIHLPVKNALIKDGWVITHEPFQAEYDMKNLKYLLIWQLNVILLLPRKMSEES